MRAVHLLFKDDLCVKLTPFKNERKKEKKRKKKRKKKKERECVRDAGNVLYTLQLYEKNNCDQKHGSVA